MVMKNLFALALCLLAVSVTSVTFTAARRPAAPHDDGRAEGEPERKPTAPNLRQRLLLNNRVECPVCLEPTREGDMVRFPCKHGLCINCHGRWLEAQGENATCPSCRGQLLAQTNDKCVYATVTAISACALGAICYGLYTAWKI